MNSIMICETENGKIEYVREGKGPVVLVFHGGHGSCLSDCRQLSLIENGFSVLIPSRPGYRGTPIESGKTVDTTADLFASLLKKLNIAKVSVIGISAGAPAAIVFTRRYPWLVEKLVLESAVVKPWFHRMKIEYYAVKVLFSPQNQKKFWNRLQANLKKNETRTLVTNLKRFTKLNPVEVLQKFDEKALLCLKECMITGNDSGEGFVFDIEHRAGNLAEIQCPTLIMHSKNDGCLPFSHAEYAHKKIKNSDLFIAPTDSHFLWFGPGSGDVLEKRISFLKERV